MSSVSLIYDILNIGGFFLWIAGMAFLPRLNPFATVSYFLALLGTLLIMGDVCLVSFIVPFVAREHPVMLGDEPTGTFLVGAILSFAVFSLGWFLFGVSSLIRKMLPMPLGLLIILGAIVGFQPLTPPNLIPLALAIGWMGIWIREKHGIKPARVTSKL